MRYAMKDPATEVEAQEQRVGLAAELVALMRGCASVNEARDKYVGEVAVQAMEHPYFLAGRVLELRRQKTLDEIYFLEELGKNLESLEEEIRGAPDDSSDGRAWAAARDLRGYVGERLLLAQQLAGMFAYPEAAGQAITEERDAD